MSVTCDEFSSLSQPYGVALCRFFFFPPVLPVSPRLSPFDTAVLGNRRSALRELEPRSLSSPSPGNQGVKMTDMDALGLTDD